MQFVANRRNVVCYKAGNGTEQEVFERDGTVESMKNQQKIL